MKAGKVWGTTTPLLVGPTLEVHALKVLPHAWCSLHRHGARWNGYLVSAGRLLIEVHQRDYDLVDVTELKPGDLTTVAPGLKHRFRTEAEGAELIEFYYPAPLGTADIERVDVGGVKS